MPECFDNTVDATSQRVNEILALVRSSDRAFDLNRIVPMPVEIQRSNTEKVHGKLDRREWATTHWGTDRNTLFSQAAMKNDGVMRFAFRTACHPPIPAIAALSSMFPDCTFWLHYVDDRDLEESAFTFRNGEIIERVDYLDGTAPEFRRPDSDDVSSEQ